jgi:hypothetical protein
MNTPSYKAQYMATLKSQVANQTRNEIANRGTPAVTQYVAAISGRGFVPAKATKK